MSRLKVAKDFKVELLYSVPGVEQGSWVNLCVDDKGRILTSDQYGGLYRFTPPPPGKPLNPKGVESCRRRSGALMACFGPSARCMWA